MILLGNVLYTVLSENTIKYSEIPLYENPKKYNEKLIENYYIKKGNILAYGDKLTDGFEKIQQIINFNIINIFFIYLN
jgi:hypothetical protein